MVQVRTGPTEYKGVARMSAPDGELPSDDLGHRKACGYVDDRLRRPSPLPPLPEQARKAGKCSPSPTYPQAPQQPREIEINGNIRRGSAGGPKRSASNHLTPKAPYKPAPGLNRGATAVALQPLDSRFRGKDEQQRNLLRTIASFLVNLFVIVDEVNIGDVLHLEFE